MMKLFRLVAAAAIAASIGVTVSGCADQFAKLKDDWAFVQAAAAAVAPAKPIIVSVQAYDGVKATATVYLNRKRCSATSGPICRSPKVSRRIYAVIDQGDVARENLENFLESHPGELGPKGLYDALGLSITTLRSIFTTYKIGGGS